MKRVTTDLDLKTEIVGLPMIREEDGLAMSSRNLRLGIEARETAPVIGRVLTSAANVIARRDDIQLALETARQALLVAGFTDIDYLEVRSDSALALIAKADRPGRIFVTAWLDGVRLIDNVPVELPAMAARSDEKAVEPV